MEAAPARTACRARIALPTASVMRELFWLAVLLIACIRAQRSALDIVLVGSGTARVMPLICWSSVSSTTSFSAGFAVAVRASVKRFWSAVRGARSRVG